MIRLHDLKLSTATIWKVLNRHGLNRLRSGRVPRQPKSYSRDIPGERVQMDTVKVAPGLFQFTAVYDCTRMRFSRALPSTHGTQRSCASSRIMCSKSSRSPSSASRRIVAQSSSARRFQRALMDRAIKFRPIRPYSPHPQRQGRAFTTHGSGGVLCDRRARRPGDGKQAQGVAALLQLDAPARRAQR